MSTYAPYASQVARYAVRALYAEVALEPKPGLVSFRDNGSHTDMTAATFVRSLFSLRHYFPQMAQAGAHAVPFATLQTLGLQAEARMLQATEGINTHRGAVFSLGLLCASAGRLAAQGKPLCSDSIRATLLHQWGDALCKRVQQAALKLPTSNGQCAARRYQLRSAGAEAALGFPVLFETTLPTLDAAIQSGQGVRAARTQAFFATMAVLDDTNTAHRGGLAGAQFVKQSAQDFLNAGGVWQHDWVIAAREIHNSFVFHRLSPGGAADMLACACFLHALACNTTPAEAASDCDLVFEA
ncbi:MAG: triphosphoribosyl-dephospho-CoA synthase MdcB [Burkholderiales bacterium PBB4]|nr:MAG: triphosphoribosyl-dephospho-CoA synthase MdcB [Burkholderiales bacterium PBB4]